jgi:diguanylate cyclase (GGDEF)-like protein/PAS domain S-box-containing protein
MMTQKKGTPPGEDLKATLTGLPLIDLGDTGDGLSRIAAQALEQIEDHVVFMDPGGVIRYVNQAFVDVTGYERDEALGETPRLLESGRHPAEFFARMWETLRRGERFHGELLNRRKDGRLFYDALVIAPVEGARGEILGYLATGRDVSERKLTDPQTGLPARLLMRERVTSALARLRRDEHRGFALIAIDLDDFRLVNERFGQDVGDRVLREVGERLDACVRAVDTVVGTAYLSSLGGDGYLILLEGATNQAKVQPVIERLRGCLVQAIDLGQDSVALTACLGVAFGRADHGSAEALFEDAASAVQRARGRGAGGIGFAD